MDRTRLILLAALLLALAALTLPASGVQAQTAIVHPFDNSVLLMISSHMRLEGEVNSAMLSGGHVLAPAAQAAGGNELDVLIQLYADQIAKLRASDAYDPALEDKLVNQLEEKVKDLREKAQALNAQRNRGRRGLLGFINRGLKALGRGTGWLMGKTMEGTGKVAEFAIEKVAPKVLKEAVLNGAPLNAALVRRVVREILKKRVNTLLERELGKLAERIRSRQEAAYDKGQPTVDPTWDAEFMEAFEEGDDERTPQSDSGGSSGDGSTEANVIVYNFSASDAFNFGTDQFYTGGIGWDKWSGPTGNYDFCYFGHIEEMSTGTVHLEFDRDAMTVSGYLEGSGQNYQPFSNMNIGKYDLYGNYRVEFTDLPAYPPGENELETALKFEGTGDATVTIGGTFACRYRDKDINQDMYEQITDQTSTGIQLPLKVVLYKPGITIANHPATLGISGQAGPVAGVSIEVTFLFDQPINVPLP